MLKNGVIQNFYLYINGGYFCDLICICRRNRMPSVTQSCGCAIQKAHHIHGGVNLIEQDTNIQNSSFIFDLVSCKNFLVLSETWFCTASFCSPGYNFLLLKLVWLVEEMVLLSLPLMVPQLVPSCSKVSFGLFQSSRASVLVLYRTHEHPSHFFFSRLG